MVTILSLVSLAIIFLRDLNPATADLNYGIEFVGGIRIPISLERSVDSQTMAQMIETIKLRINKFGLSQAVVRPLGDKEIIVEIPRADASVIKHVETILREQGHFEAIIDSKLALDGTDILSNAVGGPGGELVSQNPDGTINWEIIFAVTGEGQMRFADVASGKVNYPVYMFLDRPQNAILLVKQSDVTTIGIAAGEIAVTEVLAKQGDDILLIYVEEFERRKQEITASNRSTIVLSEEFKNSSIAGELQAMGFELLEPGKEVKGKRLVFKPQSEIAPQIISFQAERGAPQTIVVSWKAIGLRSAPTLRVEPIKHKAITQYSISGTARGNTTDEMKKNAVAEIRELKSVLSGGKLPVATVIGSYYDVAPSLGEQFLSYSVMGLFFAIVVVSAVIVARYRRVKLIIPIVLTNVIEILILVAVIGGFGTLDLSAMAGIITLIGTGVDDQIIITEELLKKRAREAGVEVSEASEERSVKERIARAFYIIFVVAGVAAASMMPLLLSGIVEVMGFALATILGVLIGVFITRPAFGVIAGELFKHG